MSFPDNVETIPIDASQREILAPAFYDLPEEQQAEVVQQLAQEQMNQLRTLLADAQEAINRLGGLITGIGSDDLIVDYDPTTGRSNITINRRVIDEVVEDIVDLGTADNEYMVYQRKANDEEDNPQYGFDYVRGVPSTEA